MSLVCSHGAYTKFNCEPDAGGVKLRSPQHCVSGKSDSIKNRPQRFSNASTKIFPINLIYERSELGFIAINYSMFSRSRVFRDRARTGNYYAVTISAAKQQCCNAMFQSEGRLTATPQGNARHHTEDT
ncbi:jg1849 [Pararge aegeria aegeria]|uniref:Jg1849 protein n=1 Tax=Pararge aegeria aegeria TaxID=348720 RepID=A0A8S4RGQ8_9NEOP|nr:jg1849 [Pararge aegeria aegeria]